MKLRLKQLSKLQVGERWMGQVEVWQKWSLEDFPRHLNLADSDLEGAWISVRKVRSQQQYQTFFEPASKIGFFGAATRSRLSGGIDRTASTR
ncbi:MAG: hypothetical protein HC840_28180, partial [Leptolyngbyaceae cyanobacterium RM2_2_4]|nr:hypothetical protein [Leptolyngbyaceae cyanobacterium RM2_2_4]